MAISFDGEFSVSAPRQKVYDFLADPRNFAPCLPTFQSLEMQDEKTANVVVGVGVGKIRGTASVILDLTDNTPPLHAGYAGRGKIMGGAFNIKTSFHLEDAAGGGTRVLWAGELDMFGKLVALAGGLIRPLARKDIEGLIAALQSALNASGQPTATG